jgi:sulfite exporter TauE/SafE
MAKTVKKRTSKTSKKHHVSPFGIYWEKRNYLFFSAGIILVIIGFYFMSIGNWDSFESLVISPVILFIAYIFIFPLSMTSKKEKTTGETEVK